MEFVQHRESDAFFESNEILKPEVISYFQMRRYLYTCIIFLFLYHIN